MLQDTNDDKMMKKKIFTLIVAVFLIKLSVMAQTNTVGTSSTDSIMARRTSIFEHIAQRNAPGQVSINQSKDIENLVLNHSLRNISKKQQGYRVRIFFDSGQRARQQSEDIAGKFSNDHPEVPVYRVYENIYYKVAVGDFRNRSDATRFLRSIKGSYPSAFLIREAINYPSL